jgi:hypothetical protein
MGLQINTQPQAFSSTVTIGTTISSVNGLTVQGAISASNYLVTPTVSSGGYFLNGQSLDDRYATKSLGDPSSIIQANSANWNAGKELSANGGTINGSLRVNQNLIVNYLSALSGSTFVNTTFTTTSALCVQSTINSGPAFYVGANGSGDIASFYDTDQNVEILHVGGNNGTFPGVGVKTSTPVKDFTVNGEISASNSIWTGGSFISGGTNLTGIFGSKTSTDSVFNTVSANSATWSSGGGGGSSAVTSVVTGTSANWNSSYTTLNANSARWTTAYNFVSSNSATATFTTSVSTPNISSNTLTVSGYPINPVSKVYSVGTGGDVTYTLAIADNNNTVTVSASNSGVVAVNSSISYPQGYQVNVIQLGTGRVTLSGVGITLNNDFNYFKTYSRYSACTILNVGNGVWVVYGALSSI